MRERQAVTRTVATRYRSASKGAKKQILDELCATTGWHRDHARKALRQALGTRPVGRTRRKPAKPRPPKYGEEVIAALRKVWAVMNCAAGKRMAPFMAEIVERLRGCGELDITDETAALLCSMSAATIDRRLAADRKKLALKGRSGTKPGTLLKSQIPIRTWAQWDEQRPGFVEIDCVGHEGGDPSGDFCQTLTVTDIHTGWTETQAVKNKAQKWVFAALVDIREAFPFPIKGIDSDNGSEFINHHLVRWCEEHELTFTRSRAGNKNDGAHVEEKNWSVVRKAVGYHRYDTPAEQDLLNRLYGLLRLQNNFFSPSQKLIEKHRHGAKVTKRYDTAQTPYQRVLADPNVTKKAKTALTRLYTRLNPAQLRRDILDLQDEILATVRAKHQPARLPVDPAPTRALSDEATKRTTRAS
ncbi:MAG: transposase family protein [Actinomycetales bacterium]|nr:transposase family protein [Actinomycetales bacterium]